MQALAPYGRCYARRQLTRLNYLDQLLVEGATHIEKVTELFPSPSPLVGEGAVVGEAMLNLTNAGEGYKLLLFKGVSSSMRIRFFDDKM